ncbi:MAG: DUF2202 domain-containing protein [Polaribacter sp.]|nr:DUF2202 domain-containing protein [Polaribacter sp.]
MKSSNKKKLLILASLFVSFNLFISCNNDTDDSEEITINTELTQKDSDALLFMLEEEKLARDTYEYLDNFWGIYQFSNIKLSEQTHMNAIVSLLDKYGVEYNILPMGQFSNEKLQNLYNQFVLDGQLNTANALQIGATIEDLDIVDLEEYITATSNQSIIDVYENLQCGSRNHLRSFVSALTNSDTTYTPQFLTQIDYNIIINGVHDNCN